MKSILAFIFIGLIATSSSAKLNEGGVATGGGGSGVEIAGKVYLVDLFQVGRHLNPFYRSLDQEEGDVSMRMFFRLSTLPSLASLSSPTLTHIFYLVAHEITVLRKLDIVLGNSAFEAIKDLTWILIDSDFLPTEDMTDTFLNREIIQIAVRVGQNVYISSKSWAKMDIHNQAALVIHEALSSFANPRYTQVRVRQLIGDLYTPEFYFRGADFIAKRIYGLPTYLAARQKAQDSNLKINDKTGTTSKSDGFYNPINLDDMIFKPILKLRVSKNGAVSSRFYEMTSKTEFEPCHYLAINERLVDFNLLAFKVTLEPRAEDESPNFDWRAEQSKIMGFTNTKIETEACWYERAGVLDWYKNWVK